MTFTPASLNESVPGGSSWAALTFGRSTPNGVNGVGLFVAVASLGFPNSVMVSHDGQHEWRAQSVPAQRAWSSVDWAYASPGGLFVAVARAGNDNNTEQVMYSEDAAVWRMANATEANGWTSVVWSPQIPNGNGNGACMGCVLGLVLGWILRSQ